MKNSAVMENVNKEKVLNMNIDSRFLEIFHTLNTLFGQVDSYVQDEGITKDDGVVYSNLMDIIEGADQMIYKLSEVVGNDICTKVISAQDEYLKSRKKKE